MGNIKFLDYENGLERDHVEITTSQITSMDITQRKDDITMIDHRNESESKEEILIASSKNALYICTLCK